MQTWTRSPPSTTTSQGEFANYNSHFGGALIDTDPYPANGCKQATICLTDEQLRSELAKYVKAQGLPLDIAHEYFLLTPPGVEDCFEANGLECSAGSKRPVYCAYHGSSFVTGGELIYSNDPYVTGNVGCDDGNHPNGTTSDGALEGGLSHEHVESITDPEPNNAWTDFANGEATGYEIGDKCGVTLGTSLGKASMVPATTRSSRPLPLVPGGVEQPEQHVTATAHVQRRGADGDVYEQTRRRQRSDIQCDGIDCSARCARYDWQFNDRPPLSTPVETTTPSISHVFPTGGAYVVALTVYAADGTSIGTARTIRVSPTATAGSASGVMSTSATLNATVNPNGAEVNECKLEYGPTTSYGSSAPCTPSPGYGSSPVAVSAGVTGLPRTPPTTSGSPRPTRSRPAKAQTRRENASELADRRDRGGLRRHADLGDPERDRQPQRRDGERLPLRIWPNGNLRFHCAVRLAAGVRDEPSGGVGGAHGPDREHHLSLQDLGEQLGRHEQRLRSGCQDAAQRPNSRDRSCIWRSRPPRRP